MERRHSSEPDALADEVHNDKGVVTVLFRGKKGTLKEVVSPAKNEWRHRMSASLSLAFRGIGHARNCKLLRC